MASSLNTKINSYSLERGLEMDETASLTPTRTGSATTGTCSLSSGATGNPTYYNHLGPSGGSGSWKFGASGSDYQQFIMNESTWANDGDYTIGWWVMNPMSSNTYPAMITLGNTGASNWGVLVENTFDTNNILVTHGSTTRASAGVIMQTGRWYYIALRRIASTGIEIYVDGVYKSTVTGTGNSGTLTNIKFGEAYTGFTAAAGTGTHFSNFHAAPTSVLTATAIAQIADAGHAGYERAVEIIAAALPRHFFRTNETSGTTLNNSGTAYPASNITLSGTLNTNYSFGTGIRKGALVCSSSWTDMTTGVTNTPVFITNNTIAFWIKKDSAPGTAQTYMTGGNGSTYDMNGNSLIETNGKISYQPKINNSAGGTKLTSTNSICDGAWHHIGITRSGATIKLYVDGTENASATNYNTGTADNFTIKFGAASTSFDSVAFWPYTLTAANMTTLFNSEVVNATNVAEPMVANTGTFVMPGVGVSEVNDAVPMVADATMVQPTITAIQNVIYTADRMDVDARTGLSDVTVIATSNLTVTVNPLLVTDASFHMPGFSIGEINSAASLDASATFPMPVIFAVTSRTVSASPMTANANTSTMPTITTQLIGTARVEPMLASVILPSPPAFKSLTSDMWYNRMYSGQAFIYDEKELGVNTARAFLKLFNDVTSNKTGENTESNRLLNNLPDKFVTNDPEGSSSSTFFAKSLNDFYATKTPALTAGTYDDYERKAVRFENISFDPAINSREFGTNARSAYSLEFSFKTTKSNQIIARGDAQFTYTSAKEFSTIGLLDGKLYGMKHTYEGSSPVTSNILSHPDNFALYKANSTTGNPPELLVGNKRIDDGQWHHVLIQYGYDNRIQYWIDGKLDIQSYGSGPRVRPRIIGFNSDTERYQSDFYTSGWSYDPGAFASERDISLHYAAYKNYLPIEAPAIIGGTADMGQEVTTRGNRGKALMLYFWPTDVPNISGTMLGNTSNPSYDLGQSNTGSGDPLDQPTWFNLGTTYGPQSWYDLDMYPVDISGKYVSLAVKQEKYKNIRTIRTANAGQTPWQESDGFKDPVTDNARYIDLINDINLADFDFICFRNYPEQSIELDRFARNEVVDSYFNVRENVLFEDFLKNLRAAVDTGISLFISNAQLAIDLKIIDRVEVVSDLDKLQSGTVDNAALAYFRAGRYIDGQPQSRTDPINPAVGAKWYDTQKNDRHRVVNTLEYLTDDATYIWTDREFYQHSDFFSWGAPDLDFRRFEYRLNGLAIGDEFYFSNSVPQAKPKHLAVPFANVKSGTIITAFADKILNDAGAEIDNPYKNYATTIALPIGTSLDGKQLGGKIFVSFTEHLSANGTNQLPEEYFGVDLAQDYWLDIALENEVISTIDYNEYKLRTYEAQLAAGQISQDRYNKWSYWSWLGDNQRTFVGSDTTGFEKVIGTLFGDLGAPGSKIGKTRSAIANLSRRRDALGRFASNGAQGLPWARVISGRIFEQMVVYVPSINSRALWWLTDRVRLTGKVVRPDQMTATVTMPGGFAQPDRTVTINAQTMLSSATMVKNSLSADTNTIIVSLPMTADTEFPFVLKRYNAAPMLASALMKDTKQFTYSVEDITLYVHSKEPILYVRKEMIR